MRQMDHQYIEEKNVAGRYLRRQLTPEERASFEQHFVDCAECLDRIALAEIFRDAAPPLKEAPEPPKPGPEPARFRREPPPREIPVFVDMVTVERRDDVFHRFAQMRRGRQVLILALAAIVLMALPAAFFLGDILGMHQIIDRQQATIADLQRRVPDQPSIDKLEQQQRELLKKVQTFAPVFVLGPATTQVSISPDPEMLELVFERVPDPTTIYRITISDQVGRRMMTQYGLKPQKGVRLSIFLSSTVFTPGDFAITLERQTPDDRYARVVVCPLRVTVKTR